MSERPPRWSPRTVGGTDSAPDPAAGPSVAILLSLFNGEAFLNAQLDSLLAQTHGNWTLFWRDDGSADASAAIMRSFQANRGAGRCVEIDDAPDNLGVALSYAHLMRHVPGDMWIAFADQDDVWFPDKLRRAVGALAQHADRPALYCARQQLTDRALAPTGLSPDVRRPPGFATALTQNIATGCTVVLNTRARTLVAPTDAPPGVLHDWWAYLLVSAAGGVVWFDPQPALFYRQHGGNSVGAARGLVARARGALHRGPARFMRAFAANIAALSDPSLRLTDDARALVLAVQAGLRGSRRDRLVLLMRRRDLRRQGLAETAVFRLWFIAGIRAGIRQ